MPYTFDGIVAINPVTRLPEVNGAGQVYARTDATFTTPLTVTDYTGTPVTWITSSDLGYVTPFTTQDHPQVWWVSGGIGILLTSFDGLLEDARAAQADAEAAAAAAAQAASDLQAYIATYPGSGRVVDDTTVAELITDPTSATRAAVVSVAGEGGGGTGDVQASDVYAVRRRTGGGTGPWQPANRGNFAGIIWVGIDPSSIEQQPGDIRYVPVED